MKTSKLIETLLGFLVQKDELLNSLTLVDCVLAHTFEKCLEECISEPYTKVNRKLEIESIIDYLHDHLNMGHWSEIPLQYRYAFTSASYLKCLILLKVSEECTTDLLKECLKTLDMGLLLGAPLQENPQLMTQCASFLSNEIDKAQVEVKESDLQLNKGKRKYDSKLSSKFEQLQGIEVDILSCPSLQTFSNKYFVPQVPVKLKDCMTHWPAVTKWLDVNYLLKVVGDRTVPVEIGSHYADENWHQKLITFKDFIKQYFLQNDNDIGYLAQHNLFNQIPELKRDIFVPDYCCISNSNSGSEPDINAWLGPEGTVSPLHQDPKNNILAQVFGTKQLILFSPNDSSYLYPYEGKLLSNTAQVNPLDPDFKKYPNFAKAKMYKCLLEPGEMLYIPIRWWHHVTALEKSFSVSFWWY